MKVARTTTDKVEIDDWNIADSAIEQILARVYVHSIIIFRHDGTSITYSKVFDDNGKWALSEEEMRDEKIRKEMSEEEGLDG